MLQFFVQEQLIKKLYQYAIKYYLYMDLYSWNSSLPAFATIYGLYSMNV